jgi:hypothetical protein
MWPEVNHQHLSSESPERLRPTQMSVGLAEVATKRREWAALGRKARKLTLERQVFPAVLGPKGRYYIIDHHHLGLALIEEKVDAVLIAVYDDLSWLTPAVFWRTMEFRSWAHPFDARGQRRDFTDIPRRLTALQDDPYRSLAGRVRQAGGCAKSVVPFAEFLWADFFRPRIGARLIRTAPQRALREAVRLARTPQARYLPGWSGAEE